MVLVLERIGRSESLGLFSQFSLWRPCQLGKRERNCGPEGSRGLVFSGKADSGRGPVSTLGKDCGHKVWNMAEG